MKTLFVHIGQMKTGTSALQHFMQGNRAVLNQQDFDYPLFSHSYPNVSPSRNGHFLLDLADAAGPTRAKRAAGAAAREECWKQLEAVFERYDSVVLSDEHLWHRTGTDAAALFRELQTRCNACGYELQLIVYLRRQDHFAASMRAQQGKEGYEHLKAANAQTWEEWVDHPEGVLLDYHAQLERIAQVVGKERITLRVYDRARLDTCGGIYADFLGCLGLSPSPAYQLPELGANVSLSPNIQEIHRLIVSLPSYKSSYNELFREAARLCSANTPAQQRPAMLGPAQTRAFLARFEEGNARIAREYLHREGPLFDPDLPSSEPWRFDDPSMAGDVIRYFNSAFMLQQNRPGHTLNKERRELVAAPTDPAALHDAQLIACAQTLQEHLLGSRDAFEHAVRALGGVLIARQEAIASGAGPEELDTLTALCLPLGKNLLVTHGAFEEQRETNKERYEAITGLKETITQQKGAITELKGTITQLKGTITQLKDTITELKTRLFSTPVYRLRRLCSRLLHPSRSAAQADDGRGPTPGHERKGTP